MLVEGVVKRYFLYGYQIFVYCDLVLRCIYLLPSELLHYLEFNSRFCFYNSPVIWVWVWVWSLSFEFEFTIASSSPALGVSLLWHFFPLCVQFISIFVSHSFTIIGGYGYSDHWIWILMHCWCSLCLWVWGCRRCWIHSTSVVWCALGVYEGCSGSSYLIFYSRLYINTERTFLRILWVFLVDIVDMMNGFSGCHVINDWNLGEFIHT